MLQAALIIAFPTAPAILASPQQVDALAPPEELEALGVPGASAALAWTDRSGSEVRFRIQGSFDGSTWVEAGTAARDAEDVTLDGMPWGLYRIRAETDGLASAWSSVATLEPLTRPADVELLAASSHSLTVGWFDASIGEGGFELQRRTGGGGWVSASTAASDAESELLTGLSADTAYEVRVRAVSGGYASRWSEIGVVETTPCTGPPAPTGLTVVDTTISSVSLAWTDNATDEEAYRVAYLPPGGDPNDTGDWNNVGQDLPPNTQAYTVGGLQAGATYRFKVRCRDACTLSAYSNTVTVATDTGIPPAPTNLIVTSVGADWIRLAWQDNAADELSYRVARLDPGEDPSNHGDWDNVSGNLPPNTTTFTAPLLEPNAQYRFKVRCRNGVDFSPYSNTVVVSTVCDVPPAPSALRLVSMGATSVSLAWNDNSSDEVEFRVARLDPGENWDNVGVYPAGTTSCGQGGLTPGVTYGFKVRVQNPCLYSPYSNVLWVTIPCPLPAQPSGVYGTSHAPTSFFLRWTDNANNETTYRVAKLDPGENPNNHGHWDNYGGPLPPNTTSLPINGLQPGGTYRFKVRTQNACGDSPYSAIYTVTMPVIPAPTGCNAARIANTPGADPVLVTWNYSGPAISGFRVARLNPGNDPNNPNANWNNVGGDLSPGARQYLDSHNLTHGQTHWYKVRAFINTPSGRFYSAYSNFEGANP